MSPTTVPALTRGRNQTDNAGATMVALDSAYDDHSFLTLTDATEEVHLAQVPVLWVVEKIFAHAPNLKRLKIRTTRRGPAPEALKRLCKSRNVSISLAKTRRQYGPGKKYLGQKKKFLSMLADATRKKLFEELLVLDREEARYTARYFCLNGEQYKSYRVLLREGDFPSIKTVTGAVHSIASILRYLNPAYAVSDQAAKLADDIGRWVPQVRGSVVKLRERDIALPEGMPKWFTNFYTELARAWEKDRFAALSKQPRHACILTTRWGFEDGRFYKLDEIAEVEGVTKAYIGRMEKEAFQLLGLLTSYKTLTRKSE